MEWVLDSFVALFVCRQQEAAKDAKQKAALSPEDSEESPNAAQVGYIILKGKTVLTLTTIFV